MSSESSVEGGSSETEEDMTETDGEGENDRFLQSCAGFCDLITLHLMRSKITQSVLLLISSILFKFGLEAMTCSVSLIIYNRFQPQELKATFLSLSTTIFLLSQAFSQLLVTGFLKLFRASLCMSLSLFVFSFTISLILLIEYLSGGTFTFPIQSGWNDLPKFIIPCQIVLGSCYGMIDVLRNSIAPLIIFEQPEPEPPESLGDDDSLAGLADISCSAGGNAKQIERLNSLMHMSYEASGTIGAFFASFTVRMFGDVFSMIHIPILFLVSGFFSILILHRTPKHHDVQDVVIVGKNMDEKNEYLIDRISEGVKDYFHSMFVGMKTVLCDRKLNFLFLSMIIPMICHRLVESVILPVYAKETIKKDYFMGILTGASNFGELVGASVMLCFTMVFRKTTTVMVIFFITLSGLSLNLFWMYPVSGLLLPQEDTVLPEDQLGSDGTGNESMLFWVLASVLNSVVFVASGFYVMSDIVLTSYLQTEVSDKSYLPSITAFIFFFYNVVLTLMISAVGLLIDLGKKWGENVSFTVITSLVSICSILVLFGGFLLYMGKKKEDEEEKSEEEKWKRELAIFEDDFKIHSEVEDSSSSVTISHATTSEEDGEEYFLEDFLDDSLVISD